MSRFLDFIIYFLIAILVVQNYLIVAFLFVLLFTFRQGAVWLIPLAFFIDGYFGSFETMPVITLFTIAWYGLSEFVRPMLLMQYKAYGNAA